MIGNGADSKPQIAPPVVHFWFTTFKQIGAQIKQLYVDTTREIAEKIPTWCREQTVCWSEQCMLERRGCVHGAVTTNEELKVFCGTPMDVGNVVPVYHRKQPLFGSNLSQNIMGASKLNHQETCKQNSLTRN